MTITADTRKVTPQHVSDAITRDEYVLLPDGRTTICILTLDNGFTVRGESSCVRKSEYDKGMGEQTAYENARGKVWMLLGFRLADKIAGI